MIPSHLSSSPPLTITAAAAASPPATTAGTSDPLFHPVTQPILSPSPPSSTNASSSSGSSSSSRHHRHGARCWTNHTHDITTKSHAHSELSSHIDSYLQHLELEAMKVEQELAQVEAEVGAATKRTNSGGGGGGDASSQVPAAAAAASSNSSHHAALVRVSTKARSTPAASSSAAAASIILGVPVPSSTDLSCGWCRRKKCSCDGLQPSCSRCRSLNLRCTYTSPSSTTTTTKRGPTPGVATHLRSTVQQLQEQLKVLREKGSQRQEIWSNLDRMSHKVLRTFLDHISTSRDLTYLHCFFFSLNNSIFPFLERREFHLEHERFMKDPSSKQPSLSWVFQYATAVAIGASISGDANYAQAAATIARIISCAMFDVPSYECLRSFLLLSFYLISHNQHRRASCCLTIAKRMLFLVPMFHSNTISKVHPNTITGSAIDGTESINVGAGGGGGGGGMRVPVKLTPPEHTRLHNQLKLLLEFLEDMLVSTPWWKQSETTTTAGSVASSTHDRYGMDSSSSLLPPVAASSSSPSLFPRAAFAEFGSNVFSPPPPPVGVQETPLSLWPDLYANPTTSGLYDATQDNKLDEPTIVRQPSQSQHYVVASSTLPSEHATTLAPRTINRDFKYNSISSSSMRGGKIGLFEFPTNTNLFQGSEPMTPIDNKDTYIKLSEATQATATATATAATSTPPAAATSTPSKDATNKKRKRVDDDGDDSKDVAGVGVGAGMNVNHVNVGGSSTHPVDLQLQLLRVMCTLSHIRGDFQGMKSDPQIVVKLHQCLHTLAESDRMIFEQTSGGADSTTSASSSSSSPVLLNLRAMAMCMRTVTLKLLSILDAGDETLLHQIQVAAKQTSLLTQHRDLTFCPMFAVFYHVVSQCHLSTGHALVTLLHNTLRGPHRSFHSSSSSSSSSSHHSSFTNLLHYLLLDLQYHERLALRWDFGRPIFQNLQQRVRRLIIRYKQTIQPYGMETSSSTTKTTTVVATTSATWVPDPNLTQLLSLDLPQLTPSNTNSNHFRGSLHASDVPRQHGLSPFLPMVDLDFTSLPFLSNDCIELFVGTLKPDLGSLEDSNPFERNMLTSTNMTTTITMATTTANAMVDTNERTAPSSVDANQTLPPRKRHQTRPPNATTNDTSTHKHK